ncbi:response regulator transcription factor [Sphingomonas sp. AP4-R1]|uniref:response regulator transcription factor n=1 Tax=Sphingomonas sp. AP4-R1 TaxID=2735134 RepID=UPI00149396D8|nr:response regulator [Sphingomonas sp. AP4-R1]QJU57979.1 response regulator transcription factor [Sphingomonas sp. AP4-R1]
MNIGKQCDLQVNKSVYVVDDSAEMRRSLHKLFGAMGIDAFPFRSGCDFLDRIDDLKPAPILMDIRMPDIDGLELMGELRRRAKTWPVIVITAHGEVPIAVRAMRLGAIEFLSKPFEMGELEGALDMAFDALQDRATEERDRNAALARLASLTQREREIVNRLATGLSNKEIARELDLSVRTVEMHRANAMRKLQTGNVVGLVALMAVVEGGRTAIGHA